MAFHSAYLLSGRTAAVTPVSPRVASLTEVSRSASGPWFGKSSRMEHHISMLLRSVTDSVPLSCTLTRPTQYGSPTNTSRPGGPLTQATFTSKTSNNTFWVVADNATVIALIATVHDSCTLGNGSSTNPSVFAGSTVRPDQVVQYYRASSVALALEGYNDTAKLNNPNASAIPLPGWVDNSFLKCLNSTIGESVPLVNGANAQFQAPVGLVGLLCLFILLWF